MNTTITKKGLLLTLGLIVMLAGSSFAQEEVQVLTLDDCIRIGLENNISVKRAQNNAIAARAFRAQAIANFLPSLQASISYDYNFGTFWDSFAARQVSTTTNTSYPNLSSNLLLFNGFSNHFNLKRRTNEQMAAELTIESSKQEVRANVLSAYLAVIVDKENIRISEARINLLQAQLDRETKRAEVGVGNLESVYNFKSQLATERLNLVTLQNKLRSDELTLVQLLRLDPVKQYEIEEYTINEADLTAKSGDYSEILSSSLNFSPRLKAAESMKNAAKYQYKQSLALRYPTIRAYGEYGSRYSSNGARNPEIDPGPSGQDNFEADATFLEQMDYNKYKYFQFGMNIPIFTRLQNHASIQQAKVNMYNAELDMLQADQTVTNTIQRVYLDLAAAQETYDAGLENLEAADQSYQFMQARYDTGNTDFYTYLESLNAKNSAEIQLVNAKYSIVFRKKILDIYRGIASEE